MEKQITITDREARAATLAIMETARAFSNCFEEDAMQLAANKDGCGMEWFLTNYEKLSGAMLSIISLSGLLFDYLEAESE